METQNIYFEYNSKWVELGETRVRGQAFYQGHCFNTEELAELISTCESEQELSNILKDLNGFFSIVHKYGSCLSIAVDHIRSSPLYYSFENSSIYVSDSAEWVHQEGKKRGYDPTAATEYLYCMYVTGSDTISRSVKKVQAGEIVTFDMSEKVERKEQYYSFYPESGKESVTTDDIDDAAVSVFKRFKQRAKNQPVILALSNGSDSRLIALMLSKLDIDNVIAFTYGEEIDEAKDVAHDLGFKHIGLDNITRSDYRNLYQNQFSDICSSIGYLSEIPQLDRLLALEKLKANNEAPDEGIVLFGHQPFEASHWVPKEFINRATVTEEEFLCKMWDIHYGRWAPSKLGIRQNTRDLLLSRMLEELPHELYDSGKVESSLDVVNAMEYWYWQERTPGYLLCTNEVDHVGYDRWLPLWDKEFADIYDQVMYSDRIGKKLYLEYLEELEGEVRGTNGKAWKKEDPFSIHQKRTVKNHLEKGIRKLPHSIEQKILYLYRNIDNRNNDIYDSDEGFSVISKSEFDKMNLERYHKKTLWYLLIYEMGLFDFSVKTELDTAFSDQRW